MDGLGSRLRSLRKNRKLSLTQLAHLAQCSPSYLSMVENGKVDPGISRLKKIADSLGVTIVDLFQTQINQKVVVRKQERTQGEFIRSKTKIEILISHCPEQQIDARLAIVHPGGGSEGEYNHPGAEFGFILEGILELTIDGTTYQVTEGDSFYFSSTRTHLWRNPSKEDTVLIWVNSPPSW